MEQRIVLFVDDDPEIRKSVESLAEREGESFLRRDAPFDGAAFLEL